MAGEEGGRVILGLGDRFSLTKTDKEGKRKVEDLLAVYSIGGWRGDEMIGTIRSEDVGKACLTVSYSRIYGDWVQREGDGELKVLVPTRTGMDIFGNFKPFWAGNYFWDVVVARVEPQKEP